MGEAKAEVGGVGDGRVRREVAPPSGRVVSRDIRSVISSRKRISRSCMGRCVVRYAR